MDDRSMQFALFLAVAVFVPVLVALGVDIARRILAALQHHAPMRTTAREHEVR
jgi:hypothetical protein